TTFKSAKLFVMNKKTGNLAIVDYVLPKDQKSAKPIELNEDAFAYVRNVRLRVVAEDGSPIESALVEITDGNGTPMNAIVTPADNGVATFQNVATGEINVKVRAKGVVKTMDSDIELPAKRDKPWFERNVRVKGDVDTIPPAALEPARAKSPATTPREPHAAQINSALQMLAGFLLLAIIIAIIYAIVKSKGISAEQALRKLGVQLPETPTGTVETGGLQQTGTPPPVVDPSMCPFCGQKKDARGNCACSLKPTAAPTSTATADIPKLVGVSGIYAGHVFELGLGFGTKTIGRESSSDVALVNDSTASRRHATITISADGYFIRDEGSSNGTFVNGVRITEQKISPGDEIQIGETRFRFEA
ncbi:MAG: FHA domain-containing protein, partial [Armatimonadota bacterium]